MRTANIHEAKTHLSRLVEAALAGEEVVIARDGVPAVRLVPIRERRTRREGGWLKGQIVEIDPDWWKPDDAFADLFESGDPHDPDPLLSDPALKR